MGNTEKHVFQVLLLRRRRPLNLVEELYCQKRNAAELEILHEDRYPFQVGPPKNEQLEVGAKPTGVSPFSNWDISPYTGSRSSDMIVYGAL